MNRIENLEEAYQLITEVRESLNSKSRVCPHCEMKKHENWEERKLRDILNGVLNRLEKTAERLQELELEVGHTQ